MLQNKQFRFIPALQVCFDVIECSDKVHHITKANLEKNNILIVAK